MNRNLFIKNELRNELKKPFGIYIEKNIKKELKKIIGNGRLIIVGDVSFKKLKSLKPKLSIIDFHSRRTKKIFNKNEIKYDFELENPPGTISKESWSVIKLALNSYSSKIIHVIGEEDLLVIPSIILSEEGDVVVYGFERGIVCVKSNEINKKIANYFIKKMKDKKFNNVVAAGTFDRLHKGHRYFLKTASFYGKKIFVGITSDEMIRNKSKDIQPFKIRKSNVEKFLKSLRVKYEIIEINDRYGFSITNPNLRSIVVTNENYDVALKINEKRKSLGMQELTIFVLPFISDGNGKKISSSEIRKRLKKKSNKFKNV